MDVPHERAGYQSGGRGISPAELAAGLPYGGGLGRALRTHAKSKPFKRLRASPLIEKRKDRSLLT